MAIYQPGSKPVTDLQPMMIRSDLTTFAEEASQVHAISKGLANTSFVPATMKGKPDEITAAILFGRELNVDPMTALQIINVIQGRPTVSANGMRGLAQAAGVKFRIDEQTQTRVVMSAKAPDSDRWESVTWDMDRARKLGLDKKENWVKQPGAMLIARATSQLCRLVAANILIGLPYSSEELGDVDAEPVLPAAPEQVKTRKISRAVVGEEPTFEDHIDHAQLGGHEQPAITAYSTEDPERRTSPEAPVERPDAVSPKTRAAIMAGMKDLGVTERVKRLELVSDVVKREVHSVNMLTEAEGRRVVAALQDQGWPEATQVPGS